MKQITLSILLFIAFHSCKKDDNSHSVPFRISGVQDLTIDVNGGATMPVEVEHVGGPNLDVSISVPYLPKFVFAEIVPATGVPPFSSVISIYALNADTGTYDVRVKGKSKSAEVEYTFRLKVSKSFPADSVTGTYFGNIREAGSWFFWHPWGVDSGSYDSTRAGVFNVARISDDSIRAGFGSDQTSHHNYRFVNSSIPLVIGDPNHGGHYFYFYPVKDSIFYHSGSGGTGGNGTSYSSIEFMGKK